MWSCYIYFASALTHVTPNTRPEKKRWGKWHSLVVITRWVAAWTMFSLIFTCLDNFFRTDFLPFGHIYIKLSTLNTHIPLIHYLI